MMVMCCMPVQGALAKAQGMVGRLTSQAHGQIKAAEWVADGPFPLQRRSLSGWPMAALLCCGCAGVSGCKGLLMAHAVEADPTVHLACFDACSARSCSARSHSSCVSSVIPASWHAQTDMV